MKDKEDEFTLIPLNWHPSKFYSITFQGWKDFTIIDSDPTFNELGHLASKVVHSFIDLYKEKYVFSEPQFGIKLDGVFFLKIGIMEKDEYERRLDNQMKSGGNERIL